MSVSGGSPENISGTIIIVALFSATGKPLMQTSIFKPLKLKNKIFRSRESRRLAHMMVTELLTGYIWTNTRNPPGNVKLLQINYKKCEIIKIIKQIFKDLSYNSISTIDANGLYHLKQLKELDLTGCGLSTPQLGMLCVG